MKSSANDFGLEGMVLARLSGHQDQCPEIDVMQMIKNRLVGLAGEKAERCSPNLEHLNLEMHPWIEIRGR